MSHIDEVEVPSSYPLGNKVHPFFQFGAYPNDYQNNYPNYKSILTRPKDSFNGESLVLSGDCSSESSRSVNNFPDAALNNVMVRVEAC